MIWTEDAIREELRRLDAVTGLHGADLPISFGYARQTLGVFQFTRDGQPLRFRFSKYFLDDPHFTQQEAVDLIRHEYAHYMQLMRGGPNAEPPHGDGWKQCCREIGAHPEGRYRPERNEVQLNWLQEQNKLSTFLGQLQLGMNIHHPMFGMGVLTEITGMQEGARLTIRSACGEKVLSARWVLEHCSPTEKGT